TGRARLRQPDVGVREAAVDAALVVRRENTYRTAACEQRHPEAGPGFDQPRRLVVDVGIVEHRVDALALAALGHPAALRALPLDCLAQQRLAPLAGDGGEAKLVGTGWEQHRDQ